MISTSESTVNPQIFARTLFSQIALKFETRACFTFISKRQINFAFSQGFYFHETSLMQSFAKIKPSRKFSNLHMMSL